jgi:large subunit ribosomal protein L4e
MKATLKSQSGETKGQKELPVQFHEPLRADLIKRAVLSVQASRMQPHGTDSEAGSKYSSKISRRRRNYKGAYGIGISRVPRKIMSHSGTRFNWVAAAAPNTVGGRRVHPPEVGKILTKKVNRKERRKAIRSALGASVVKELVLKRGHIVEEYPLVIENSIEELKKTKEVLELLSKLGLDKELERSSKTTMKTGKAKRRGRTVKGRKGPLFVVSKYCSLMDAAKNIPGIEVSEVKSLNAELLAPGCDYGRLVLYTEGAIDMLDKMKLFMDDSVVEVKAEKTEKAEKKEKKAPAVKKVSTEKKATSKKPAVKETKK